MGSLYENINMLCVKGGIRPSKLCTDTGISRGLITDLKMGRKNGVTAVTAQKIASYFGVSVGFLLGEEPQWFAAVEKFGFCWEAQFREEKKAKARAVISDPDATNGQKYDAQIEVFKALFSRSLQASGYDLNHIDFPTYVSMMLPQEQWQQNVPVAVYKRLVAEFGTNHGIPRGTYFSPKEKAPVTSGDERSNNFDVDEADEIAAIYRKLDDHGKGAVKAILNYEHSAVIAAAKQTAAPNRPTLTVKKRSDGFVETKVYDQPAAAGFGNYLDDPAYHIEQYPANIIPSGTEFGVKISGNSMSPDIRNGATVFVQSRGSIEPGQIGIFVLNGEAYCKKLMVDKKKGQVRLVSLNPDYADRILEECDDFRTVGLVLGQWNP